ncbi:hypothetical protein LTR84_010336 [Exophiala bonariae]|uniref:Uncharacterized protein n=1 Tax=Exophiala bonariae TaxID=1690606 RepID=A0AAV9MU85_9EURO|nr:hypothetical protein LTR84_010336 [Exophiala bonariae]
MIHQFSLLSVGLLALVTPAFAQLPYNPTRILPLQNGSAAYLISPLPSSSQYSLSILDTSSTVNATSPVKKLLDKLPFLSDSVSRPFITVNDAEGISVLAGSCKDSDEDAKLWRFTRNETDNNGTWTTLSLDSADTSLSARYLSAGFTFSQSTSIQDASLYIFGGMCPNGTDVDTSNWVLDATYSNTMMTLAAVSPSDGSSEYQVSLTGSRAPPIPEAGLTITPLAPTFSNTTGSNVSQQQNFVLLGGHTQTAFLNMSQLAIFSLPQQSWAFVAVSQSSSGSTKLRSRNSPSVEPRSGHTALLTADGSRIVVLGGWVGNVSNPAEPQVAILELGQGYGGQGDWAWTIPSSSSNPFSSGAGIYGHGAAILPGNVMMVTGGYSINSSASQKKRQPSQNVYFFNTTSLLWSDSYTNPFPSGFDDGSSHVQNGSTGLKPSEKAGLGAGIGVGIAVAFGIAVVWLLYSRKLRARRALREKELRALALGAERLHTPAPGGDNDSRYPSMRTASWGGLQERQMESLDAYPWAPPSTFNPKDNIDADFDGHNSRQAERTGALMEVPSPTRGLRKSLSTRNPGNLGPYHQHPATGVPGPVFRIDEEDESSQMGSLKRRKSPQLAGDRTSVTSDPFKDPLPTANDARPENAAHERQREVEGWVEDWQSAAESMTISRSTSQAHSRTYSNLSQFRSQAHGDGSGRGSPEKSDRTGSNLSEKSITSVSDYSRSVPGTVSRSLSQRSVSAGYALFAGAAAAMSSLGSRPSTSEHSSNSGITRAPSNRSVSLGVEPNVRSRGETFSSVRSGQGQTGPAETQMILNRNPIRPQLGVRDYQTVERNPSKDKYGRAGSLTGSGRRALNLLGSVKRVFTGTGTVDVNDRVATIEGRSGQSSPTKHSGQPEMSETFPRRTLSAGASFWREKQGPGDWNSASYAGPSSSIRRRPVPGLVINDDNGILQDDDADWDVETAVQQRVVQVMFTVPKEKLRVVNADALSLLSSNRSEVDHEEDKEREQMKRMSSVREGDEDHDYNDTESGGGKGKGRAD